jgi:hypothetical protein
MAVNIQQYMTQDFYIQLTGEEGKQNPIHVSPDSVNGDFYYPVHDGTLPLDKTALFNIWSQMFQTAASDPAIRETYSIPRMFEEVAELGGIQNIEGMRMQSQEEIDKQVQAGNMVTPGEAKNALGGGGPAGGQSSTAGGGQGKPSSSGGNPAGGPPKPGSGGGGGPPSGAQ